MPETVQDVTPPFIAVGYTDKVVFTQAQAQEPIDLRTMWQQSQGSWRDHPVFHGLPMPLLCYAELWTGVELLPEEDRPAAAETLDRVLRASRVLLVADNVAIAREAARAQAAYRRRGGMRGRRRCGSCIPRCTGDDISPDRRWCP